MFCGTPSVSIKQARGFENRGSRRFPVSGPRGISHFRNLLGRGCVSDISRQASREGWHNYKCERVPFLEDII